MNGRSQEWWAPRLLWFAIITNAIMAVIDFTVWRLTGHLFNFILAVFAVAVASGVFAVLRYRQRHLSRR